jgi:hypothetical protein
MDLHQCNIALVQIPQSLLFLYLVVPCGSYPPVEKMPIFVSKADNDRATASLFQPSTTKCSHFYAQDFLKQLSSQSFKEPQAMTFKDGMRC